MFSCTSHPNIGHFRNLLGETIPTRTKTKISHFITPGSYFKFLRLEIRCVIITEKVKLLLTLHRHLPPPFLLSKAEASCSSPSPQKVSKNCTLSGALVVTARLIISKVSKNFITHSALGLIVLVDRD